MMGCDDCSKDFLPRLILQSQSQAKVEPDVSRGGADVRIRATRKEDGVRGGQETETMYS
jgi:hypothetical protein